MQPVIPNATNLKAENATSTQYAATINGKTYSGITSASRFWASIEKALDDGAVVEPYVPPTPPNPALIELSRLDNDVDRVTEDLIDVLVGKGVIQYADLPAQAVEKVNRKKELRSQL